jgi:hypothetical protein
VVLILEVAAGIVLAVFVLAFLPQVLVGVAVLAGLAVVGLAALYAYSEMSALTLGDVQGLLEVLAIVGALYGFGRYLLYKKGERSPNLTRRK